VSHPDGTGVDWAAAYRYLQDELESVLRRVADRMEQLETELGATHRTQIRSISLDILASGRLRSVIAGDGVDVHYAFHVYRDDTLVRRQPYSASNTLEWEAEKAGIYRVRGFARRSSGTEADDSATSRDVTVDR
jgi:hypothetical protein